MLWAIAIGVESGALLTEDREAARRARRDHDLRAMAPADPDEALDAHHFAERFGLFLIILLGEVVVEAGQTSVDGQVAAAGGWAALVAAMLIAAGLWWLYFDSAADINRKVLELSGGSPTMARAIFAVGHMLPAFALLITAAAVGLLLEEDPPRIAYWLASVGVGMYLAGSRVFLRATGRVPGVVRTLLLVATFLLGRIGPELSPHGYIGSSPRGSSCAPCSPPGRRAATRSSSRDLRATRPARAVRRARVRPARPARGPDRHPRGARRRVVLALVRELQGWLWTDLPDALGAAASILFAALLVGSQGADAVSAAVVATAAAWIAATALERRRRETPA